MQRELDPSCSSTVKKGLKNKEAQLLARATISSLAATLTDGLTYQTVLFIGSNHYILAAFMGALVGAVTNFSINRWWAFPPTGKPLGAQAIQYAMVSGLTYLGLQLSLIVLVEWIGVSARLAWAPAKIFVWAMISYPLQRLFVFAKRRGGQKRGEVG